MKLRKHIWLAGSLLVAITLNACNLGATPAPTQDVAAIQSTALAQVLSTVSAQQTQTAAAIPPTALPTDTLVPTVTLQGAFAPVGGLSPTPFGTLLPGLTPLAFSTPTLAFATVTTKNGCNDAAYILEYPNKATEKNDPLVVGIGETVEQFFRLKNTGTCKWDEGFAFVFMSEYSSPEVTGNNVILPKNKESDYTAPGNEQSYKGIIRAPKVAGDYVAQWKMRADDNTLFGPMVYIWIRVRKP